MKEYSSFNTLRNVDKTCHYAIFYCIVKDIDFPSFLLFKVKKTQKRPKQMKIFSNFFLLKNDIKITHYEKNWSSFAIIFHSTLNLWTVISKYTVPCRVRKKRENKNCCHGDARSCLLQPRTACIWRVFFVCLIFARVKRKMKKKVFLFKQVSFLEVHAAALLAS